MARSTVCEGRSRIARSVTLCCLLPCAACAGDRNDDPFASGTVTASGSATAGSAGSGPGSGSDSTTGDGGTSAGGTDSGDIKFDAGGGGETDTAGDSGGMGGGDPTTCEEAADNKTYIGCDFWPTVTGNQVWSLFDFAVVVTNAGPEPADVTIERGGVPVGGVTTIPPDELRTIYLPWIPELKGPDADACGAVVSPLSASVRAPDGAYHLQSTRPVTVYQFSALEYAPSGGPAGKDWSSCPAAGCTQATVQCFSYSNDASLLLPTPAFTNNYRVTGYTGWSEANQGATLTVTGTEDGTNVTVTLSSTGEVAAGGGLAGAGPNGKITFPIDRGEVVELVGTPTADLSGSLVQSDLPVQVIFGLPCTQVPYGNAACDHVEESVFPAETLGTRYFVSVPTSPGGAPVAHLVRIYGNVDGTKLSYPSGKPAGFPDTIDAGEVFEIGKADLIVQPFMNPPYYWDMSVTTDFEIEGDHEFAVASFQFGAQALGDGQIAAQRGDPAQSLIAAVEQYRRKYVFLAPLDYPESYADIVHPVNLEVLLDGAPAGGTIAPIGGSGFVVRRVKLPNSNGGAHVLTADEPFGLQVMGYGDYTSYQYPGGLNLEVIAPPPPPPG